MIRRLFRLVFLAVVIVVLLILFAPSLLRGAGNSLITSLNNTNAQGVAQVIPHDVGNGADLQVKLDGLTANSNYYISLDQGQCGGTALFNVGKITTDANGSSTATLSLSDLRNALTQGLYLDVHAGTDTGGQSIACGQVLSTDSVISQFSGSTPTDTPTPTPNGVTPTSSPITIPTNTSTLNSSATDSTFLHGRIFGGFPNTGVAPAQNNGYDNYTYPRKY